MFMLKKCIIEDGLQTPTANRSLF